MQYPFQVFIFLPLFLFAFGQQQGSEYFRTEVNLKQEIQGSFEVIYNERVKTLPSFELSFPLDVFKDSNKAKELAQLLEVYKKKIVLDVLLKTIPNNQFKVVTQISERIFSKAASICLRELIGFRFKNWWDKSLDFHELHVPIKNFRESLKKLQEVARVKNKQVPSFFMIPVEFHLYLPELFANLGIIHGITRFCISQRGIQQCAEWGFSDFNENRKLFLSNEEIYKNSNWNTPLNIPLSKTRETSQVAHKKFEPKFPEQAPRQLTKQEEKELVEKAKHLRRKCKYC